MSIVEDNYQTLRAIWNQQKIPVILRRGGKGKRLWIRLPYLPDNKQWLQNGRTNEPKWDRNEKYWETPKAWFNDLVNRSPERFDKVYIIQPYREQEICAPACMNAVGHDANVRVWAQTTGSTVPLPSLSVILTHAEIFARD